MKRGIFISENDLQRIMFKLNDIEQEVDKTSYKLAKDEEVSFDRLLRIISLDIYGLKDIFKEQ